MWALHQADAALEERRARHVWAQGPHSVANATAQAGIALIFDLRYRRATEPLASTEIDKRTSEPWLCLFGTGPWMDL